MPEYTNQVSYEEAVRADPGNPWHWQKTLECAFLSEPDFEPGRGWQYCNTGYWLLGTILERVADLSLDLLLNQHIFQPFGLQRTAYPDTKYSNRRPQMTSGWSNDINPNRTMEDISQIYHPGWAGPAGAIVSTASEVLRFFQALFLEKCILKEASLKQLTSWQPVPGNHPAGFHPYYGLGLECERETPFGASVGHGGCGPGYVTFIRYLPAFETIAVIFSNSERRGVQKCLYDTLKSIRSSCV